MARKTMTMVEEIQQYSSVGATFFTRCSDSEGIYMASPSVGDMWYCERTEEALGAFQTAGIAITFNLLF